MEAVHPGTKNPVEDPRRDLVSIQVNGVSVMIRRGRQTVAAIKKAGRVLPADTLVQVVGGKLDELEDGGELILKGGEVFVSHPRDCGASHPEQ